MNFDNNALMKSAGIGAGAGFLIALFVQIPFVVVACCCIGWVIWAAVGASYGMFVEQNGGALDMGGLAAGGAVAGAVGGIVRGIVSGIITAILTALGIGMDTAAQLAQLQEAGIPPEMYGLVQGGGTVIGIIVAICFTLVLTAIFGALGGVAYSMYKGRQGGAATPAV
jgi:hypothetical protein